MSQTQSDLAHPQSVDFVTGKGLVPRNLDELWRVAQAAARSGLVPKGVDTPEKCFIAMQLGAELGLSPLQAVQGIAVINGRPSVWGDTLLAVCQRASIFDHEAFAEFVEGQGDNRVAVCRVRRRGNPNTTERRFSVADAKKAKLWGKAGPWETNPERMLQMRARGFALRDTFADLLRGYYTAEEAGDLPPRRVEVTVTEPAAPAPTSRTAALAASLAAPAGPPPEVVAQIEALRADEPEVHDVQPEPDHEVAHAMYTEIRMLVAGASKTGLSRIRKDFNVTLFDDESLSRLSNDDIASLRDALAGEQTEAT